MEVSVESMAALFKGLPRIASYKSGDLIIVASSRNMEKQLKAQKDFLQVSGVPIEIQYDKSVHSIIYKGDIGDELLRTLLLEGDPLIIRHEKALALLRSGDRATGFFTMAYLGKGDTESLQIILTNVSQIKDIWAGVDDNSLPHIDDLVNMVIKSITLIPQTHPVAAKYLPKLLSQLTIMIPPLHKSFNPKQTLSIASGNPWGETKEFVEVWSTHFTLFSVLTLLFQCTGEKLQGDLGMRFITMLSREIADNTHSINTSLFTLLFGLALVSDVDKIPMMFIIKAFTMLYISSRSFSNWLVPFYKLLSQKAGMEKFAVNLLQQLSYTTTLRRYRTGGDDGNGNAVAENMHEFNILKFTLKKKVENCIATHTTRRYTVGELPFHSTTDKRTPIVDNALLSVYGKVEDGADLKGKLHAGVLALLMNITYHYNENISNLLLDYVVHSHNISNKIKEECITFIVNAHSYSAPEEKAANIEEYNSNYSEDINIIIFIMRRLSYGKSSKN